MTPGRYWGYPSMTMMYCFLALYLSVCTSSCLIHLGTCTLGILPWTYFLPQSSGLCLRCHWWYCIFIVVKSLIILDDILLIHCVLLLTWDVTLTLPDNPHLTGRVTDRTYILYYWFPMRPWRLVCCHPVCGIYSVSDWLAKYRLDKFQLHNIYPFPLAFLEIIGYNSGVAGCASCYFFESCIPTLRLFVLILPNKYFYPTGCVF